MQRLAEGAAQADLARSYGVSQATISRLAAPALSRQARPSREEETQTTLTATRNSAAISIPVCPKDFTHSPCSLRTNQLHGPSARLVAICWCRRSNAG
jgi:hypothetical protein